MINVDLSKVLHPRVFDFFAAFLPGLFFESCLLLANPQSVQSLVGRANLDRYTTVFVALLMAFVVGSAFMLWVRLIQIVLIKAYARILGWWPEQLERLRVRAQNETTRQLPQGQPPPSPAMYLRFLGWRKNRKNQLDVEAGYVRKAWGQVAAVLLERYGLKAPQTKDPREWGPWTDVLGTLRIEDLRGRLLTMTLHATGWSGLASRHFAPALHTRSYTGLCMFLIGFGLMHDGSLAWDIANPLASWRIGLRNTMDELRNMHVAANETKAEERSDPANVE
jgi:hypothetical protein